MKEIHRAIIIEFHQNKIHKLSRAADDKVCAGKCSQCQNCKTPSDKQNT